MIELFTLLIFLWAEWWCEKSRIETIKLLQCQEK